MNCYSRVILIVLDGVGVGALPDAAVYGDAQAATLPNLADAVNGLALPHLQGLGLGNICRIKGVPPHPHPLAAWGMMAERSAGKDSVTGHWEIAGLIQKHPFATFPQGFPEEIIQKFSHLAGQSPLGNIASSGTDILRMLGEEHLATGRPIVYTSSDSVFQIAAHEKLLPPESLYRLCAQTLEMLTPYGLCRVIARPFIGGTSADFRRTPNRHDFPVPPCGITVLDRMQQASLPTCGIGKIGDLFAGRGLDRSIPTRDNRRGVESLLKTMAEQDSGLIFLNLVDFDMLYGHRLDIAGFARALKEFDQSLPTVMQRMKADDLLVITADHGCDPTTAGTDHSREYVPLLAWSRKAAAGVPLGVRDSFSDIAATLAEIFALDQGCGKSFLSTLPGCKVTA